MDLRNFVYKETLQINPTQKTICILGQIKGQQQKGQAIIILTPKVPQPNASSNQILSETNDSNANKQAFSFTNIQSIFQNDIYSKFQVMFQHSFQIQAIYPIEQKHRAKYRRKYKVLQNQTGQFYESNKEKILQKQLKHIGWVKNIVDGVAQAQRVLYQDQDIVLTPDFKFHNLKEIQNLHLLCIFKDFSLHSIRDLTEDHISLLQKTQNVIDQQVKKYFPGIDLSFCRVYFHYPPTFYQLHLHIQNLELNTKTCNVERCHLLSTVIQNIKMIGDYYQKVTIACCKQLQYKQEGN